MSFHKYSQLRKAAEKKRADEAAPTGTAEEPVESWDEATYREDPVGFARKILRFKPTEYQVKLLTDEHKRIVVIWPRQSGKTTTLSIRMIWYAAEHPRTTSLIVALACGKA